MDVLQYIDELQQRQKAELEDWQQRLAEAEEQAAQIRDGAAQNEERLREVEGSFEQENARLRLKTEEQAAKIEALEAKAAACNAMEEELAGLRSREEACRRMRQEQEAVREELARLRETARALGEEKNALLRQLEASKRTARETGEQNNRLSAEKLEMTAKAREMDRRCRELTEANERYEKLVGDVGSFIMEIRSMGQHFLDAAYKRSDSCLDAVAGAADRLEQELASCRGNLETARQELLDQAGAAGVRLEEWVQTLDETAEKLRARPISPSDKPAERPEGSAAAKGRPEGDVSGMSPRFPA